MTAYQLWLRGHLDPTTSAWLGGTFAHTPDGDTRLTVVIPDQAALYGVLARSRDMGVTLVALAPLSPFADTHITRGNTIMSMIKVEQSQVIDARPEEIYAVIRDYRVGHPAIVPKPYFTGLTVEKGGVGEGTVVLTEMNVFGRKFTYHQIVTEPEPGRVLVESDMNTPQYSSFTLDPVNGGAQTRVTITAELPASPGLMGTLERLTTPSFTRRIFKQELDLLAAYVKTQAAVN